jgi:tRNA pseudouridine-54 N-methylase
MMRGKAVTPASRFEIVQTTSPAPGVVVTQIRRRELNGEFSEMAMYVLAKRGGQWGVAGAQNTPVSDVLPGQAINAGTNEDPQWI